MGKGAMNRLPQGRGPPCLRAWRGGPWLCAGLGSGGRSSQNRRRLGDGVNATAADLHLAIDANGLETTYRFEYIAEAAYQANLNADPPAKASAGAARKPPSGASRGLGTGFGAPQHLAGLAPATVYHYRPVATNSAGTTVGPDRTSSAPRKPTNVVEPARRPRLGDGLPGRQKRRRDPGLRRRTSAAASSRPPPTAGAVTYSSADSFGAGAAGRARRPASTCAPRCRRLGDREHHHPAALRQLRRPTRRRPLPALLRRPRPRAAARTASAAAAPGGECPVANPPLPGRGAPRRLPRTTTCATTAAAASRRC